MYFRPATNDVSIRLRVSYVKTQVGFVSSLRKRLGDEAQPGGSLARVGSVSLVQGEWDRIEAYRRLVVTDVQFSTSGFSITSNQRGLFGRCPLY